MARKKKPCQPSITRRMHRALGAGAAVFVIFMVLSGIAINHSNSMGLDRRHIAQPFLLDWYGFEGPPQIRSFATGEIWLSFAGSQLYLNDDQVATIVNGAGAVALADALVAAGSSELLLLDRRGGLIERIPWGPSATGGIEALGLLTDGRVAVKTSQGTWLADTDMLAWEQAPEPAPSVLWSSPEPAPAAMRQAITRRYMGSGLSVERLLLDIHSGRFFGSAGVVVYDLLALSVGFLAISGLVLWLRNRFGARRIGKHRASGHNR